MSVTLEIPDDVSQAMRVPPPELEARLLLELAAALYAQQVLSLGKAAQLAGLTRFEMNSVLARRGVPMHYSAQELAEDVAYARSCQRCFGLISLGATGHFDLLKDFYQTVLIPNAVWQEITASPMPLPGTTEARQARQEGWLRVETPRNRALVSSLAASLDIGEAEAITLASELGAALLLIDESDGRAAARNLGLTITGTLGILVRAKLCGRLFALKPVLDQLVHHQNFRLSRPLYEQVLQQVGEQA